MIHEIARVGATLNADLALDVNIRQRQVWTNDEKKHLDRAAKVLLSHADRMLMLCGKALCPDPRIQLVRDGDSPRGAVLRCGCTDREFSRLST